MGNRVSQCLLCWLLMVSGYSNGGATLWMTEGSPVIFSDTTKIQYGMTGGFEGAVDYFPAVGVTHLAASRDDYVAVEAEWVIIRPEGFSDWVDDSTEVILQGMADAKYFAAFYSEPDRWQSASIGNNVIAAGKGIRTTLGDLVRGDVHASVSVAYEDAHGRQHRYHSASESIQHLPLVDFVNGVIASNYDLVTHINLGAIGPSSTWVNLEPVRALATLKTLFSCAVRLSCRHQPLPEQVLRSMSEMLRNKQAYMADTAMIEVMTARGESVGRGSLTVQRGE